LIRKGVRDRFHLSRHSISPEDLGIQSENRNAEGRSIRFGYLGQVCYPKGLDLLVSTYSQLAAEYKNTSLAVWGSVSGNPAYLSKLEERLNQTPNATVQGRYEPAQIGEILHDIDMLVIPSRWPEIGPFVILEAFAAQTPVIAARIGNMPELVEHDVSGLLFEPNSASDLWIQMRRVLEEPGLLNRLQSGIPPVRTPDDEMSELIEIYAQVMEHAVSQVGFAQV
jgi:glycosyltransferase involved in cell wall biosynthesis